jgi:hypothetical protein
VAKKLAKLKPDEKADYEARASAKNQTLEEYVLRRIQKKAKKHESEHVEMAEPVKATNGTAMFFSDLGGDPGLFNPALPLAGKAPRNRSERRTVEQKAKKSETKEKPADGLKDQSDFISIKEPQEPQEPMEPVSIQVSPDAPVFTYTPLPDGSCPLNPKLWKSHKTKHLPKQIEEARRAYQVEQRLEKRLRKAKGDY